MNTISKKLISVALTVSMIIFCCSCNPFSEPLSIDDTENYMNDNKEDIQEVANYLLNLDYKAIQIRGSDGKIFADQNYYEIESQEVQESIKRLFENGCLHIGKRIEENALTFRLWHRDSGGVESGIAYAIDTKNLPSVQFLTELAPMSDDSWYYYVANYEEWRTSKNN